MTHSSHQVRSLKKRNLIISAAAVLVVLAVGYALISSRAAGFFSIIDPSGTTLSGNATLVSDASIAGGKALQFNAPATTPPPTTPPPTTPPPSGTLLGWQITADNIGLKPYGLSCASLPLYTGSLTLAAGTTISQKRIEGSIDARAGNITIEKSCIQPKSSDYIVSAAVFDGTINGGNGPASGPITIRDSEIDATKIPTQEGRARSDGIRGLANVYRTYIHGMGTGIALAETNNGLSAVIENNYITQLTSTNVGEPTHSDGFTVRDFKVSNGRTLLVKNNRFNCDGGNESGAFFIQTTFGPISNVTAEGNLLEGGNYRMSLEQHAGDDPYSNIRAINNRVGPSTDSPAYAAAQVSGGPGWTEWTNNYMYDPAKPDAKGALVPKP